MFVNIVNIRENCIINSMCLFFFLSFYFVFYYCICVFWHCEYAEYCIINVPIYFVLVFPYFIIAFVFSGIVNMQNIASSMCLFYFVSVFPYFIIAFVFSGIVNMRK